MAPTKKNYTKKNTTVSPDDWADLHKIQLNGISKNLAIQKILTLKHCAKLENLLMADIRAYVGNTPIAVGVCITQYEYNWLAENLSKFINYQCDPLELMNETETRVLRIEAKNKICVTVKLTKLDGKIPVVKSINLYKPEMLQIVNELGNFYNIIEAKEEGDYIRDQEYIASASSMEGEDANI